MEDLRPSYYAIIPANVRYDTEISPNAKLLYGEITALCNQKGFCWATNEYFSKLYGVSERTIKTLIKQLNDKNYIKIELINNNRRKIYIEFTKGEKNFTPPGKKLPTYQEENFTHNNTSNNTSEYLSEEIIKSVVECDWLS